MPKHVCIGSARDAAGGSMDPELEALRCRLVALLKEAGGRTHGNILGKLYVENPAWRAAVTKVGGMKGMCERFGGMHVSVSSSNTAEIVLEGAEGARAALDDGASSDTVRTSTARPASSEPDVDASNDESSVNDDAFTAYRHEMRLLVDNVWWSHDTIKVRFRDGRLLVDTLRQLLDGELEVDELPPFDVWEHEGQWHAITGNRRLWVLKEFSKARTTRLHVRVNRLDPQSVPCKRKVKRMWTTRTQGKSVQFVMQRRDKAHFPCMAFALAEAGLREGGGPSPVDMMLGGAIQAAGGSIGMPELGSALHWGTAATAGMGKLGRTAADLAGRPHLFDVLDGPNGRVTFSSSFARAAKRQQPADVQQRAGLEKGMRLQALAGDGKLYFAEVVEVSMKQKRAQAPVKIHYVGYSETSDEWVGTDRLRSKELALRMQREQEKATSGEQQVQAKQQKTPSEAEKQTLALWAKAMSAERWEAHVAIHPELLLSRQNVMQEAFDQMQLSSNSKCTGALAFSQVMRFVRASGRAELGMWMGCESTTQPEPRSIVFAAYARVLRRLLSPGDWETLAQSFISVQSTPLLTKAEPQSALPPPPSSGAERTSAAHHRSALQPSQTQLAVASDSRGSLAASCDPWFQSGTDPWHVKVSSSNSGVSSISESDPWQTWHKQTEDEVPKSAAAQRPIGSIDSEQGPDLQRSLSGGGRVAIRLGDNLSDTPVTYPMCSPGTLTTEISFSDMSTQTFEQVGGERTLLQEGVTELPVWKHTHCAEAGQLLIPEVRQLPILDVQEDLESVFALIPPGLISQAVVQGFQGARQLLRSVVIQVGARPQGFTGASHTFLHDDSSIVVLPPHVESIVRVIGDSAAGMIGDSLHRISYMSAPASGKVCGVMIRVGRAILGACSLVADLLTDAQRSLVVLGAVGSGKTTVLRDAARLLAQDRAVVVIDQAGEVGGGGAAVHPSLGFAWRVSVPAGETQMTAIMGAVDSHAPEVVVADGMEPAMAMDAAAYCRTAGVRLVCSARGTLQSFVDLLAAGAPRPRHGTSEPRSGREQSYQTPIGALVELPRSPSDAWKLVLDSGHAAKCFSEGKPYPVHLRSRHPLETEAYSQARSRCPPPR
ncbi:unnamed protein product [Prorocentrum cordatum]|uniref:Chromo domain-containing protein n=1 Tax=Prorocentrum cordatum TaxID=2364126 RepID=A0ABN9WM69_9DINO|nr:unnamed protein product [Polarella glacialis]